MKRKIIKIIQKFSLLLRKSSIGGQLLALLFIIIIFTIGTGGKYLSLNNIITILGLASIPFVIVLGLHQVIILGAIDLSVEGTIALCGVIAGMLVKNNMTNINIGFWVLPIVMVIGAAIGLLNGLLNTKLRIPSIISSLGISWVFFGLAVMISGGKSIVIIDERFWKVVSGKFIGIPIILIIAISLFLIFQTIQSRSRFYRYVYAIGGDEQLAKMAGVKVDKIKIIAFMVAGIFYGLAAFFLVTRLQTAAARMGNYLLFPAITATAVGGVSLSGGIGNSKNAALGAIMVAALNNGMILMKVNLYAQNAVIGIVLIIAVALSIDRRKLGIIS